MRPYVNFAHIDKKKRDMGKIILILFAHIIYFFYLCSRNNNKDMDKIIARTHEIETLERKYRSGKSEFVIVYGRRRIGKTFLVNNVFADRFTFTFVGAKKQKQDKQLQRFAIQLKLFSGSPYAPALNSWEDAFRELRTLIEHRPKDERKVIFLDEMPWIDTVHSSFVEVMTSFLLHVVLPPHGWLICLLRTREAYIIESQSRYTCVRFDLGNVKNIFARMAVYGTDILSFSAIWLWVAFPII